MLYDNEILFNIILRKVIGWSNFVQQISLNIVQEMVGIMS